MLRQHPLRARIRKSATTTFPFVQQAPVVHSQLKPCGRALHAASRPAKRALSLSLPNCRLRISPYSTNLGPVGLLQLVCSAPNDWETIREISVLTKPPIE